VIHEEGTHVVYIRILTADDASIYREMRLKALRQSPESFLTTYEEYVSRPLDQTARQLDPTDHDFTLGALTDDGQLVGTVTFIRKKPDKVDHVASVQAMFVSPEFRRHGVGRMLLMDLIGRARRFPGLEQIQLTVVQDNSAATTLYESVGFRRYGVERQAMKSVGRYWDELHMVVHLVGEETSTDRVEPIGLKGFSHVTIDVANLDSSLEFYVETLQMQLVHRGRRDAYLEWGVAWVCLQERPDLAPPNPQLGVDHVAFYIDSNEFHAAVEVLRQSNIPIVRGPVHRGGGWTVNFLDPDGTELELHTATLAERMMVWE
jgi:RimJ/RimL family protein N-acetyltransferase/catechol 2,3-dioxygenase-like lactoylglutathione lyase family enzyme